MAVVDEEARLRSPSLDLAARTLKEHVPHVLDDLIISDQVYVARDSSFDDAVGVPEVSLGDANFSVRSAMSRLDLVLSDPDAERTLVNALAAPAVASDPTRKERLTAALRTDLLADDGGSYGRYELLREMQPVLMRASVDHPLAVMFIDMNGLKQINDEQSHSAGDAAIAGFRAAVRRRVRVVLSWISCRCCCPRSSSARIPRCIAQKRCRGASRVHARWRCLTRPPRSCRVPTRNSRDRSRVGAECGSS